MYIIEIYLFKISLPLVHQQHALVVLVQSSLTYQKLHHQHVKAYMMTKNTKMI